MISKIFWFFVILFIGYILIVFSNSNISKNIDRTLKIDGFTEKVLNFKKAFDKVVTTLPTKDELEGAYNIVKEKIHRTKQGIDNIREKADEYENKYKDTVELINETKDKLKQAKDTIDNVATLVNSGAKIIENLQTSSGVITE